MSQLPVVPSPPPTTSSRFPASITEALSKTITQQARIRRQVAAAHPRYRSARLNWWSGCSFHLCCREMAGVWEAAVTACRASCPLTTKKMGWSEHSWGLEVFRSVNNWFYWELSKLLLVLTGQFEAFFFLVWPAWKSPKRWFQTD